MVRASITRRVPALAGSTALAACILAASACGETNRSTPLGVPSAGSVPMSPPTGTESPFGSTGSSPSDSAEPVFTPIPDASQAPDTGSGGAAGDIPDNAVFLAYQSAAWQFRIQYVEGWQVTTHTDGVVIRDKDSSETVQVVNKPADLEAWVTDTDLPALQAQPGFALVKRNHVTVGSATLIHLVYHALSPPDSVTGKQVRSTVDRFYVEGPALAVISLATPDGVDNVDAFRQIIGSFAW